MVKDLSVRHTVFQNGERYKVLVDSSGMPLYYPNLFITSVVRGEGRAVNTISNALIALKTLYKWMEEYGVDLEERFQKAKFLKQNEYLSIRDFVKKPLKQEKAPAKKVATIFDAFEAPKGVSSHLQYHRLTVIANYLKFLATILTQNRSDKSLPKKIEDMEKKIKSSRPKIKGRNSESRLDKAPSQEVADELLRVIKPGNEDNPFTGESNQYRNYIMILLLFTTGIRRGELLNIQGEDIDAFSHTLKIVRRPDSRQDSRVYQPVAKTRERTIPLADYLIQAISHYSLNFRTKHKKSGTHPYLFVNHKEGPSQGMPVTNVGFGKMLKTLQSHSELLSKVHAHSLRHLWNYRFSVNADAEKYSEESENSMRSYLMGWKPTSGTAEIYNQRHIVQKSSEAMLEVQKKSFKSKGGDLDE